MRKPHDAGILLKEGRRQGSRAEIWTSEIQRAWNLIISRFINVSTLAVLARVGESLASSRLPRE
jgi:hypothetical protein